VKMNVTSCKEGDLFTNEGEEYGFVKKPWSKEHGTEETKQWLLLLLQQLVMLGEGCR